MDNKIIQPGDYVPNGLVYPPWGDGSYRVFKLSKVEDIMTDKLEDEMENYPEGEHDDQVDARVPTPTLFSVGFNIAMAAFELVAFLIIIFVVPIVAGYLALDVAPKLYEAAQTNMFAKVIFYWIAGALATAGTVLACIGIYAFTSAFLGAIKLSLIRIRMRKLN